jgi:hypothetical protein
MSFRDRLEGIHILLELGRQFKAAFELKMSDLPKAARRGNGEGIIADVEDDPQDHAVPGTRCQPEFHATLLQ